MCDPNTFPYWSNPVFGLAISAFLVVTDKEIRRDLKSQEKGLIESLLLVALLSLVFILFGIASFIFSLALQFGLDFLTSRTIANDLLSYACGIAETKTDFGVVLIFFGLTFMPVYFCYSIVTNLFRRFGAINNT